MTMVVVVVIVSVIDTDVQIGRIFRLLSVFFPKILFYLTVDQLLAI